MQKIAIWGTGSATKKFYCICAGKFEIQNFIDNDERKIGKYLFGKKIIKYSKNYPFKIVIASSFWREIVYQLSELGLIPYKDFTIYNHVFSNNIKYSEICELLMNSNNRVVSYESLKGKKKIAIVYGNCQTAIMEKFLAMSKEFSNEYLVIENPRVYGHMFHKELMDCFLNDNAFWKTIDLFIYQPVSKQNRFSPEVATDKVMKKLGEGKKSIYNKFILYGLLSTSY